ncbi:MAPEG family protein [Idiomarina sp. HP20-50]|uniref:MAPEG family protein n=1 Tax=Idiomarina sp. HP20-50 TaxID=3070813 RepID=UPI00294B1B13|nr:MAPEG family protein [Idiomarina sp. HP20-50]MDV6317165.1 MAPEG family protein [Idiomarina sp. HP20-50]
MTSQLTITGLYAGILTLIYLALAAHIIRLRWKHRVGLGTGEAEELKIAVRIHGNFIEYVPLALILFAMMEMQNASAGLLHGLGIALIIARLCHAAGLTRSAGVSLPRTIGVLTTFAVLLLAAGYGIGQFVGVSLS